MSKIDVFIVFLIIITLFSPSVYAYVDPGTGGMVIGNLWTFFAAGVALISAIVAKYLIRPIKEFIVKAVARIKSF